MASVPPDDLKRISDLLYEIRERLARLEAFNETEADRCPFREEVAGIRNNAARLEKVETQVDANQANSHPRGRPLWGPHPSPRLPPRRPGTAPPARPIDL